ncbi:autotransporter outer membrane beta-barrel domain-containing protein, partial [Shigella boydii]|nr:autotransporter outer membrane beta-barrel domain-containing protein [Shigella boydii]EFX6398202.1 autotransporter outer membrane beta-barrel domain-containing protein [Shigella boydii]EFY9968943.1 autotransporter outer membrane beta-barrel domain-containing protein [Shigella boydii]EFY9989210.1 autotransporter outer membrane beta-barrel domain-containing protein [Shigella boydii]EFZ6314282.1 autotransporter outer membrane beta-barrel domain-containing protein [Shigella boydii]
SVNQVDISNSVIHGSITSELPFGYYSITPEGYNGYTFNNGTTTDLDYNWYDGDVFTLNVSNSTIDDDYEALYFTDTHLDGDKSKSTNETFYTALGVAVNLDVESNINITNNSRVAGIALSEGNTSNTTYTSEYHQWDNNINVSNSTVTSGSQTPLEESDGFFGKSAEPSDYAGNGGQNDVALSFTDNAGSNYSMKNNVNFDHSTLLGDVEFTSHWNNDGVFFYSTGHDSNGDGVLDTNGGWVDDAQNVDELNITLNNGSKWVGSANMSAEVIAPADMYDVAPNSLTPGATIEANDWGRIIDNKVFQSGVFNVALNNSSEWNTVNSSVIDTLAVNNGSQVNVTDSSLVSDTIGLINGSSLNIGANGVVATDHLTVDSYSTVNLTESTGWNNYSNLYTNTITVTNGGVLDVNVDQFDTEAFRTDKLELTDYANMALSIPSANTNIWNLEQDTVGTRLTNSRHGLADNGGAWVSYFGGNFNGDNGTINYDQDVNGIMVGVDTKIDGNNAKWIVGAAAGFAKGDMNDRSGKVDQDSQTAYIYSSAHFANNVFVDGSLSYSHFNNDLSATMSNGTYVDGSTNSDAWGFGLKAGYDFKLGDAGYVTPYGSVSGLFQSGDDYQLSNDMKVDGQSYDSMRYELGVDAGYTFTYSEDQALTPYFKLAYVYDDSNNDNDVNGDSIDNGTEGSAVRVGLGTQFSFTKNFSAYTDANYLGGGDVDQDWSANVGVKYTW